MDFVDLNQVYNLKNGEIFQKENIFWRQRLQYLLMDWMWGFKKWEI
jgi:hypothetical protein